MPVVFFLDTALEADETMNGVDEVVLSYTFYRQKPATVAAVKDESKPPSLIARLGLPDPTLTVCWQRR